MSKTMPQDTRVPTAREQMVRDYAPMPVAQLYHAFRSWGAYVEGDGDEKARLRHDRGRAITTTTPVQVVDAGLMTLPYSRADSGEISRTFIRAVFDYDNSTATVYRAGPRSVLGYTPYPAQPPLNESGHTRIAELFHEHVCAPYPTATVDLHDNNTVVLDAFLDEVHAAIEHPAWCQRQDCWDKDPRSYVEHRRDATAHEWVSGDVDHHARASMTLFAETITPDPDEPAVVELSIGPDVRPDHLVFDNPAQLRALGQALVIAADDLEWEFDDANKSTINGVGIDWSWSITGNDKQAAGGDAR